MRGLDSCYATFDRELRAEVDACGEEWMQLATLMRTTPADNPEEAQPSTKGPAWEQREVSSRCREAIHADSG